MSRTNISILIGLVVAAFIAWQLGGSMGVGVLGGYLLGASLFAVGAGWQRNVVREKPERSMQTLVLLALGKLFVILISYLVLRFVDGASDHVHPKGFLLAFVAAVLVVSFVGSYDAMLVIKNRKAQTP